MSEHINEQELTEMPRTEEVSTVERCLTFESGDLILYISTKHVIEIINNHSITKLPLMPPYIRGIINLRGQILPVVDIQLRMGKESPELASKTFIMIDIDLKNVRPSPLKRQQKLLDGMVTMEDGSVFMSIDCQALSSPQ